MPELLTPAELIELGRCVYLLSKEIEDHTLPALHTAGLWQHCVDLNEELARTLEALGPLIEGGDAVLWGKLGVEVPAEEDE